MVKSEEQKRCDSSELGSDSAFALRSPITFTIAFRPSKASGLKLTFALEHLPAADACYACATDIERYAAGLTYHITYIY